MSNEEVGLLDGGDELFGGVLVDGFQHRQAQLTIRGVLGAQQVLAHQRLEHVGDRPTRLVAVADGFSGCRRPSTGKDRKLSEEAGLLGVQQVVAPSDRVADGLLALGQVARAALQQRQPLLQALEEQFG